MNKKVNLEDILFGQTLAHHVPGQPENNIAKFSNGSIININEDTEYEDDSAQMLGTLLSDTMEYFRSGKAAADAEALRRKAEEAPRADD